MPANRVTLIHYTAAPVIGGVENLMEAQCSALRELGYSACVLVGDGGQPGDRGVIRLELLNPGHPRIAAATARLNGRLPPADDPLVQEIESTLRAAVLGSTVCIVHNAFTVYLNPFLTIAVHALAREMTSTHWIAWCYDLSANTAFWPAVDPLDRLSLVSVPAMSYVAPSKARANEVERFLALPSGRVRVISPALSYSTWLGLSETTVEAVGHRRLEDADPLVLVPAKLLPHKNLELAVRAAAMLQQLRPRALVLLTAARSPHQPDLSDQIRQDLIELSESLGGRSAVRFLSDEGEPIRNATVRDLMLLSDLVLLLSTEEGYGLPIWEAAALRAPVVCSNIPAFRAAAGPDGATFFDVAVEPDELAKLLARAAEVPANRQRRATIRSWGGYRQALSVLLTRARSAPDV